MFFYDQYYEYPKTSEVIFYQFLTVIIFHAVCDCMTGNRLQFKVVY